MTHWIPGWDSFPEQLHAFWSERHLCSLSSARPDGTLHTVPVGVALDVEQRCAWVITDGGSVKARRIGAAGADGLAVSACQIDGARWSTLEGRAVVDASPQAVRRAENCYEQRYRRPRQNPTRVALRIEVARFLVSSPMLG